MCGLKNIIMFGDGDGVEEFRHDVVMAGAVAALVERSQSNRFHQKHFALHILAELAYTCRKGNLLKIFEDEGAIELFFRLAKTGTNVEKNYASKAFVKLTRVAAGEKGAHMEQVSSGTLDKIISTLLDLSRVSDAVIDDILVVLRNISRGVYRSGVYDASLEIFFLFVGNGTASQKKISTEGLLDMATWNQLHISPTHIEELLKAVRAQNIDACQLLEGMAKRKTMRQPLILGGAVGAIFASMKTADEAFRDIASSALVYLHKSATVEQLKILFFSHLLVTKSSRVEAVSIIQTKNVMRIYRMLKSRNIILDFKFPADGGVEVIVLP